MNTTTAEAVLPVSPTQQGMLFHQLDAPDVGYYLTQIVCTVEGEVHSSTFREAWRRTIERHGVLRSAFSLRQQRPYQVVFKHVPIAIREEDWRASNGEEWTARLRAFLHEDRRRGFDLRKAPLQRLALFRIGDDRFQLVWTHPHALLDGWSAAFVIKEFLAHYEAVQAATVLALPPPRPYEDYLAWLAQQDRDRAQRYWQSALAGFERPTPLPHARRSSSSDEQAVHFERRPREFLLDLKARLASERLTLGSLVQGAWAYVLGRYAGESDVVFGMTASGRPPALVDVESMVGLFINTQPVRVLIDEGARLADWLRDLQARWSEAEEFAYAPLVDVHQWSEVAPSDPLFDSVLVVENFAFDAFDATAADAVPRAAPLAAPLRLSHTPQEITGQTYRTHYPLLLTVRAFDDFVLRLTYRTSIDDELARNLVAHVAAVVSRFVDASECRLDDICLLSPQERRTIVETWAGAKPASAIETTIHERVADHARRRPDAVAILAGDASLSYGELNRRADAVARHLWHLGIRHESPVALSFDRSAEFVIAALGVLKAGGAYVPLEPGAPVHRTATILDDAGAPVVLTTTALAARLPATWAHVVCLDALPEVDETEPAARRAPSLASSTLACIVYTSGSTGGPKGVAVEHRNVTSYVRAIVDRLDVGAGAHEYGWISTPAADLGNTVLFAAAWSGGRLHIVDGECAHDAVALGRFMASRAIACLKITPTHLAGLLDAQESPDLIPLACLVLGGESLPAALVDRVRRLRPTCRIWNHYGPTECTVGVLVSPKCLEATADRVPLGTPLAGVRLYVLDTSLQPLPAGAVGELFIGGAQVARGYAHDPSQTASRFVPDPFSDHPGRRLYRTGDRARWNQTGEIEFLGRADDQVKIRGHRVEIAEVERAIGALGHVLQAVVLPHATDGQIALRAYVHAAPGSPLDLDALRAALRERLPEAMVPADFIVVERIPITPNGKVDRRALSRLELAAPTSTPAAPRTPIEALLADIFAVTLQQERVGPDDDFFRLGGHSLVAMQVISRIREAFGVELSVRVLFEEPTPAKLAPQIAAARAQPGRGQPPLVPVPRSGDLPLSFAQQRLWFVNELDPNSVAYNTPRAIRMRGRLDARALGAGLTAIVARHEVLRTSFPVIDGHPVQRVHSAGPVARPVIDLSALPAAQREMAARRLAFAEEHRPFALTIGPMLRARLLRLGPDEHVLLFALHHIVSDGWSTGVLLRDLAAFYRACAERRPIDLPSLDVQYADYAVWQREWLQGAVLEQQLDYWRRQLSGTSILELPTDRPRPARPTHRGRTLSKSFDGELSAEIRNLGRREGATTFMVLLAGVDVLLAGYTRQRDVTIGSAIANRTRREIENNVGFFANTIVLRTEVDPHGTFRDLLKAVRSIVLDAYASQDVPFDRLVEDLQPQRDLTQSPLFRVVFNYQRTVEAPAEFPGLQLSEFSYSFAEAKFDLLIESWEYGGQIHCSLEYATDLFDETTIERLWTHFEHVLRQAATGDSRRVAELGLASADALDALIRLGAAECPPDVRGPVHEWFERWVERAPAAIALVEADRQVSFAGLNARANQIAHFLIRSGVGPETRVALFFERSLALVTAVVAVLKSGAAYVPLDTIHPPERLAYMLEESGAAFILTDDGIAARLPAFVAPAIRCDDPGVNECPTTNPGRPVHPEQAAYVIYTSGSTGRPKGSVLTHANLSRLLSATERHIALGPSDVSALFHSYAYDVSVWEIWGALAYGGRLVVIPFIVSRSPDLFHDWLAQHQVTALNQTPSAFRNLMAADSAKGSPPLALEWIMLGGEALDFAELGAWAARRAGGGPQLVNVYGPTETTVFVTWRVLSGEDVRSEWRSLIGRGLPDVELSILDQALQPVPTGVPGELFIGGGALARGYLGRPRLTAQRFVPHPFGAAPGVRLYATGDKARWTPNGEVEYLGRLDQQIKIRGFRVEPAEIASVLERHEGVQQAVVVAREQPSSPQLVAYVVPASPGDQSAPEQDERESRWRKVFDDKYAEAPAIGDPTFNIAGWNSTYTGQPFGEAAMREWVDSTVARLQSLGARRILELGCGSGLLLFRLAPDASAYWASDFSAAAIGYVRQHLDALGPARDAVQLWQGTAADFDLVPPRHFDLVILNSVVQYFPDVAYLLRVVERAVDAIRPGGTVFLGDLRTLPLHQAFVGSVQIARSESDARCGDLRRRVQAALDREEELVLSPEIGSMFAAKFPRITRVEALLRRGRTDNELTKYRYDLLLHVEEPVEPPVPPIEWRSWTATSASVDALRRQLADDRPAAVGWLDVPNARTVRDVRVIERLRTADSSRSVASFRQALAGESGDAAIDPEQFWRLADEFPYDVSVSWLRARGDGAYDVALKRRDVLGVVRVQANAVDTLDWARMASDVSLHSRQQALQRDLRRFAADQLPEYMVPAAIVVLRQLPLTSNGKLDRRALPEPEPEVETIGYVAPRTAIEAVIAGVWSNALGVERIGAHDGFFAMGGHSLMAVEVVARLREALGLDLAVGAIFEHQTVEELAQEVERLQADAGRPTVPAIVPVERRGEMSLSFAQQRLWYICQIDPASLANIMTLTLRVRGAFDVRAWRQSVSGVTARHEVLRTRYPAVEGRPVAVIALAATVPVPVVDVSRLGIAARERAARRVAAIEAGRPFDLAAGPLQRWSVVRLGADEHVVVSNVHHLVSDGWSMGVFARELTAGYAAARMGTPPALAPLPVQYADYAVWQRSWLQGAVLEELAGYWRQQLAELPGVGVPSEGLRPAVADWQGASVRFAWRGPLVVAVKQLARAEGSTLFMVLLAALQVVLSRWTGSAEVAVGTPMANRPRAELDGLIGFFVNTLVLRGRVQGAESFRAWVRRVRETTLQAYAHQDLPFEKLVEVLAPDRDLARHPFFEVLLNAIDVSQTLEHATLSTCQFDYEEDRVAKYPLTVYFQDADDELTFTFEYQTALLRRERVELLCAQFEYLMAQAIANPDGAVSHLSLVLPDQRPRLPDPASAIEERAYPPIDALLMTWADRSPHSVAVRQSGRHWSYAALGAAAQSIAARIATVADPAAVIAIVGRRSFGLCAAMAGTLVSGRVLLLIDPHLPMARQQLMIEHARTRALIVVGREPIDRLLRRCHVESVIDVDDDGRLPAAAAAGPRDATAAAIDPNAPAYLFYTSGTTGVPKAVLGRHKGLSRFLVWQQTEFGVTPADRSAQLTALSFDVVLRDILLPLTSGALLCLPPAHGDMSAESVLPWMAEEGVTLLHSVPSIAESWTSDARGPAHVPSLRVTFFAGEPLTSTLVERWRQRIAPAGEIVNLYGPTEATLANCYWRVPALVVAGAQPVGWPLSGTQALVVRDDDQQCGIGEPGEVVLRTPYLTLGYLGGEAADVQRFCPNPFRAAPGDLVYRTGDRGSYRVDGALQLHGRLDDQVKIRGVRIELGEVEHALLSHPLVERAAASVRPHASGDPRLVAYIVTRSESDIEIPQLFAHLEAVLPDAAVPSAIVRLDRMPTTANGKLDRAALPDPETSGADREGRAPRTVTEEIVAAIWSQLLGVERLSVDDNFFRIGGHSLLATQVVSRLRRACAVELSLRALLEAPTVAGVAERIDRLKHEDRDADVPPLVPVPRDQGVPLSSGQMRLWFLHQLDGDSVAYHIARGIRVRGAFDVRAWRQSVSSVTARHEVLRTRYPAVEGRPVAMIQPAAPVSMPVVDVSRLGAAARKRAAQRVAANEAGRPFDLAAGPLQRWRVVRLAADEHVVVSNVHHLVSDGWSMGVFARELTAGYAAARAGTQPVLAPLPVQYADYAVWQRSWLQGDVLEELVAYWRQQLAGLPEVGLPSEGLRPAVAEWRGASVRFAWRGHWVAAVKQLARAEGATLFMVLLAALQVVLSRWTGSAEVAVGTPMANRPRAELDGLIGFFVNTLVLRGRVQGGESFRAWVRRVRETTLQAYAHQDLPFEKLVEVLAPDRDLATSPLFSVLLIVQNASPSSLRLGGAELTPIGVGEPDVVHDLAVSVDEAEDGSLGGFVAYRTDLFRAETIARFAGDLERLLSAAMDHPDVAVATLPWLTDGERQQLTTEWSGTELPLPAEWRVTVAFDERAAEWPDAVAVVAGSEQLTYRTLAERSSRLAHTLRAAGVGADVPVAVLLERSPDLLVTLLAVLKSGGAYVPLDPANPDRRIAVIVEQGRVPVLVTSTTLLPRARSTGARAIAVDEPPSGDVDPIDVPAVHLTQEHLAYIIFTSGSTGVPKGVAVPHRGLANLAYQQILTLGLGHGDRFMQMVSFGFDVATHEWLVTLLSGATLVLVGPFERGDDGVDVLDWIRRQQITVASIPTALLATLSNDGLPSLRAIVTGGEALPRAAAERWSRSHHLVNAYGPTEATICTTRALVSDGALPPSIGRPIANARVYVVDGDLDPVPVGLPGELLIGGIGIARGYVGQPASTAASFVPDPFSSQPGARAYRTADRVRWMREGEIEFFGRLDDQVKLRGHRIELGEIRSALERRADVAQAAVVLRPSASGERRLVAYVVGPSDIDRAAIVRDLRATLPGYMVPSAIVRLDSLPLTLNGKLDERALPEPWHGTDDDDRSEWTWQHPAEELVAQIWAEALGVDRVGRHDNFFGIGGHSLLANEVIARVRRVFAIALPVRAIFEAPTVPEFAARVAGASTAAPASPVPPLVPAPCDVAPLSFGQQRLSFVHDLDPDTTAYHVPMALELAGPLAVGALSSALSNIVRRHAVLRTSLPVADGRAVQRVHPFEAMPLGVADLTGLPVWTRDAAARRLTRQHATLRFDLRRGPIVRAALLRLHAVRHVLVVTMHHVATDGWSMGIFSAELTAGYAAYAAGREPVLPALPIQYTDYAIWQREWLHGDLLEQQTAYWRDRLHGAAVLDLATDFPRPPKPGRRAAFVTRTFPPALGAAVHGFCRARAVTPFMTLLAAFQTLLARQTGQHDIVVGTDVANRSRPETEGLIGFFVNQLILRSRIGVADTFNTLVDRVRETTLEAYEHAELPFEKLVEELAPPRDLTRAPIFQVKFVMQNTPATELRFADLDAFEIGGLDQSTKVDLNLMAQSASGTIDVALTYAVDLFTRPTAERMLEHLQVLVTEALAHPDRELRSLSLVTAEERRDLERWATSDTVAEVLPVHVLVERHAAATSDAALLVVGDHTVTYAAMNRRANQLAHYLRGLGVGPEVRVAVCADPGVELLTALLATLKAGGAYVIIDPAAPWERIAFMVEDAHAAIVLTDSRLLDRLPNDRAQAVCLDQVDCSGEPTDDPGVALAPANLAYVLYTSGSTGQPKAVAVEHRHLGGYVAAVTSRIGFGRASYAVVSALSADLGNTALYGALAQGGIVHLIPHDLCRDGAALADYFSCHQIDVVKIVPSHLKSLMHAAGSASDRLLPNSCLVLGGERTRSAWADQLRQLGRPCAIWNHYGPTECTVGVAVFGVRACSQRTDLPLGTPLAGNRLYVVDDELQQVGVGVPGELLIGGDQVARGYLDHPAATAVCFMPDPFAGAGQRVYRTGDRVRWLDDGTLEFLGRVDLQVKLRGHRIEPGEIEAALAMLPGVAEAAVTLHEHEDADKSRLVAYVVCSSDAPGLENVRRDLARVLPEFMLPSHLVVLDRLPRTANGKIDRRSLPAPDRQDDLAVVTIVPRDNVETHLQQVWRDVLDVDVKLGDDFFALGGHSISAVSLTARLQPVYGEAVTVRTIFEQPTIEKLAAYLRRTVSPAPPSPVVPLRSTGSRRLLFCLPASGGMMHSYIELARHLSREQPVFGIQCRGLNDGEEPLTSIADMAERYVDDIRAQQPCGPYQVLGWSMGGVVAYEVARRLTAGGDSVSLLALVDSMFASGPVPGAITASEIDERAAEGLALNGERTLGLDPEQMRVLDYPAKARLYLETGQRVGVIPGDWTWEWFARWVRVTAINSLASLRYRPGPFDGRAVLINTRLDPNDEALDLASLSLGDSRGLDGLVRGGLAIHHVDGRHADLLARPAVERVVAILDSYLDPSAVAA